ncbi:MAG: Gfo/Idh/MocA family oxidoreductase [Chloroflexi bacterium]|nr:Gfo/Idh/MocA family oxidoreductase [Chloroflexota bacterium]
MADPIRLGIIGANVNGWAGRAHMPALAAGVPGVELVAVCTTRQESADEAAKKFGVGLAFSDRAKMLAHPDIDVVAVVVKLPAHRELAMDVIAAGKHVYTEWPLGTTTAQAQEIADAAAAKGVRTCVGLQARHSAEYRHLRGLIDDGYVGDVLSCSMMQVGGGAMGERPPGRVWQRDAAVAANTLSIGFGHAIDGLTSVVGPIESVAGVVGTQVKEWTEAGTGKRYPVTAPDDILLSGRLRSGASVSVHVASAGGVGTGCRIDIHGTEGTLVLEATGSPHSSSPARILGARRGDKELAEIEVPQDDWITAAGLKGGSINIGKLWKSFADSFAEGDDADGGAAFAPSFESAVEHHKLIDAVRTASETGQTQKL